MAFSDRDPRVHGTTPTRCFCWSLWMNCKAALGVWEWVVFGGIRTERAR
jgi:hypothetical protein